MACLIDRFLRDETGATAIEYGLIAAFLCIGILVALTQVRDAFGTFVNDAVTGLRQS